MLTLIHNFKLNGRRFVEVHKKEKLNNDELQWLQKESNGQPIYVCEEKGWQIFEIKMDRTYQPLEIQK